MRKSCIQVRRQSRSRIKSSNHSSGSILDISFDLIAKSQLGERITVRRLQRVATEVKITALRQTKSSILPQQDHIFDNYYKFVDNSRKIPEYEFLKNKQAIQNDPFLKAKMKYLINKQKPNLINQMPKMKILLKNEKKISQKIMNQEDKEFITLKSQCQKEKNKKLYLLANANLNSYKFNA